MNKEEASRIELEYQDLSLQKRKQYIDDCSIEITKEFIHWKSTVEVYFSRKKFFVEFEGELIEATNLNSLIECLNDNNISHLNELKFYSLIKYLAINQDIDCLSLSNIANISKESEFEKLPNHDYISIFIR